MKKNHKKKNELDLAGIDYNYGLLIKELNQRGAKLKFIKNTKIVSAEYCGQKELLFDLALSRSSFVSAWIAGDKFYSKKFLEYINIPVPKGNIFHIDDTEAIISFAEEIGFPLVMKPLTGSHGDYVYSHIDSQKELMEILNFIHTEYLDECHLLIEEHIQGHEYRLFVTKNNFFAAVNRIPANIRGDGKSSIQSLIDLENFRRINPRTTCLCTIKVDDVLKNYLKKKNLSLKYKPRKGKKIQLRYSSNVCMGGNCIDVTDQVHPSIKEFAFKF
jgi:D-alanine-D-alanine ligase-like ATP-grasp enzyme